MSCKTCPIYGHTVKTIHETIAACAKCSCQAHNKDKCTSTEVRCWHLGDDHQALSRNCPIFKKETEIVQIQTKEPIPRLQAIWKVLRINPHLELIFSNAVKNNSNRSTSKFPTRTNEESQSKSSDNNSPPVPSYGHRYYTEGKWKKKRRQLSPPLTVVGRRVKRPRK